MFKGKAALLLGLILLFSGSLFAQEDESDIELFLIDSYVTQKEPYLLRLSFFTTEKVKSEVVIDDLIEFEISDTLAEDHQKEFDVAGVMFSGSMVTFEIKLTTQSGEEVVKGPYELVIPHLEELIQTDEDFNLLTVCCFGGVIFGLPSPTAVFADGETKFALSKEIPLLSYYTSGYNYPSHYVSVEYQYIFDIEHNSIYRAGYKYLHTVPVIEYLSAGVNYTTDFSGYNGVSPEISAGLMRFYNVFTLYARYRYNTGFEDNSFEFHEVSVGIFSNFFSFNF